MRNKQIETQVSERINICLVCTAGGHFEELSNLENFYKDYPRFWITNRNKQTESGLKDEPVYFIDQAHFKKPLQYLRQIPDVWRIFKQERPTHIITTGSGRTVLIPYLFSRIMKLRFFYIETYCRVNNLTLLGQFLLKTGQKVHTQWNSEKHRTSFIGPVFNEPLDFDTITPEKDFVFVTVGTRDEPFTRLIQAVDELVQEGIIQDRVIVQAGHTEYESNHLKIFDFCTVSEIERLVQRSKYVITQESAGIGNKCLKFNKKFIVMPRQFLTGELPSKSDMKEDLQFKLAELGYTMVVHSKDELADAVRNVNTLRTGFHFSNHRAVSQLREFVEV